VLPWLSTDTSYSHAASSHEKAWVRLGVWPSQSNPDVDAPTLVSNAVEIDVKGVTEHEM
jgi:hypothetical protein